VSAEQLKSRRVLIANDRNDRLGAVADAVVRLGHDAVVRQLRSGWAREVMSRERPDVVLVGLGPDLAGDLSLISEVVAQSACPVIALLATQDPSVIREAARRGVFACVLHDDAADLESAIDVALERFAEYHGLQDAFGRRVVIEQAKGILMARHAIDADAAFAMLRMHSQNTGRKLADVAGAVVKSHQLLGPPSSAPPAEPRGR
jgi:AmiR/NasT family two-component response regulator